jgi:SWI/SNF-related matrix-associated actin-dependent regulator 1 of chromatin subfamily A
VADECHRLKNPKAKRTQRALGSWDKKAKAKIPGLADRAARKLFLTGTPLLNRPIELHPILAALDPKNFGNFWYFAKRYCAAAQTRYGWDLSGASHLDELQTKLRASCMIRRLKEEVLTELPPKRRQVVCLPPDEEDIAALVDEETGAWKQGAERLQDLQDEVDLAAASGDAGSYEAAVLALRQAAKTRFDEISRFRHALAVAKVPAVIEHVEDALESNGKCILFGHHHDVLNPIAEHFGTAAVKLTGETPMDERQGLVERFQTDPECKLFIGSISAAGVGLTLTAASLVIFAELDWVPANITQAEDRAHRITQKNPVLIQHLVVDGSLDSQMAKTLVRKQELADTALDNEPVLPQPERARPRRPRPTTYPVATPDQRAACAEALQILAGMCDGARMRDGAGFNKIDAGIGHRLAQTSATRELTDGEVWLAQRIVLKYKRQYGDELAARVRGTTVGAAEAKELEE